MYKYFKKLDFSLKALDSEKGIIKAISSLNNIIPEKTLLKVIQNAKDKGIEKIPMKYMYKEYDNIGSFLVDKMRIINGNLEIEGKIDLNTSLGKGVCGIIRYPNLSSLSVRIYIYDAENKDDKRIIKISLISKLIDLTN